MRYHICRDVRQFGPNSPDEIRNYVDQGSVLTSDLAREETSQSWMPVPQVLVAPVYNPSPPPPSLHWALVLLLSWITLGLFGTVWMFVQSIWVKNIDPQSKATRYNMISLLIGLVGIAVSVPYMLVRVFLADDVAGGTLAGVLIGLVTILVLSLVSCTFLVAGVFGIRKSMERYYNTTEPIGLRLSGVMLFLFNFVYLQYHFTRIAEWKRTGVLRG